MNDLPSCVSFHFVQNGMVNVLEYQVNSFLFSEYLNEVYEVRVLQHLQRHFTLGDIIYTLPKRNDLTFSNLKHISLVAAPIKETFC